jgi:preprotein translocase subunit SecA
VPIESKTVAKAIERAQNTVEARNAEMRKDVLKYDEVMDQQRKVIYERRLQIIDGEDLEERTEDLLEGAAEKLVAESARASTPRSGTSRALIDGLTQYYPTKFSVADLSQAPPPRLVESIVEEALEYYEQHAESMPGGGETMRQIERDVMLQIIDQRWRDHLAEMDNLKDGIHLRWTVGQADPLNAWQSEGYNMFGQLMEVIDNDYLRYILHVEAIQENRRRARPRPGGLRRGRGPGGRTSALAGVWPPSRGPTWPRSSRSSPGGQERGAQRGEGQVKRPNAPDPDALVPIVKAEHEKVGRNDPCWCGSGKKFKLCHGAA